MTCNDVSAITAGFYEIYKSEVHPIDTAYRYDDHFSRLLAVVSTKKKKRRKAVYVGKPRKKHAWKIPSGLNSVLSDPRTYSFCPCWLLKLARMACARLIGFTVGLAGLPV